MKKDMPKVWLVLCLQSIFVVGQCFGVDLLKDFTQKAFAAYPEYYDQYDASLGLNRGHQKSILKTEEFEKKLDQFQATVTSKIKNLDINRRFVQRVPLGNKESQVCLMGDIHGSLHSLLRNLHRLVVLGHLESTTLKIKSDDFYMIFLGDYINGGSLSLEVIDILLTLKLVNWVNVYLINGEHELKGFEHKDYEAKRLGKDEDFLKKVEQIFNYFPMAVFIGWKDNYVQCSHSGVALKESFKDFLSKDGPGIVYTNEAANFTELKIVQDVLHDKNKTEQVPTKVVLDFMAKNNIKALFRGHQDSFFSIKLFLQSNYELSTETDPYKLYRKAMGFVDSIDIEWKDKINLKTLSNQAYWEKLQFTEKQYNLYLKMKWFKIQSNFSIKSIFLEKPSDQVRRAQAPGGLIIDIAAYIPIFDFGTSTKETETKESYKAGPYNWREFVNIFEEYDGNKGIGLKNFVNIVTLTTAAEGRNLPYDSFCILQTKNDFTEWRLKIYETPLDKNDNDEPIDRNNKYVELLDKNYQIQSSDTNITQDGLITIKWNDQPVVAKDKPEDETGGEFGDQGSSTIAACLESLKKKLQVLTQQLKFLTIK